METNTDKKRYLFSLLLIFIAGLINAYTYLLRDNVFATMQTGNIIYLCINLARGNFNSIYRYILSIVSFSSGIFFHHFISRIKKGNLICIFTMFAFYVTGFLIPVGKYNLISVLFICFGVAIQVQLIRSVYSFAMASTMCTGNLRSFIECIGLFISTKEKKYIKGAWIYFSLILSFAFGVYFGALIIL